MGKSLLDSEEYELFGYPDSEQQDCDFLDDVFSSFSRNVHAILDIACGTGRHALEMARRGYQVTGVDLSQNMLDMAAHKAEQLKIPIALLQKDMSVLELTDEFDAAYILFNTICLLYRNDDLIRFFEGVHTALKSDGLFVIEVGNLWPIIAAGKLTNTSFTGEEKRDGVLRKRSLEVVVGPYNSIMDHIDEKQFWREGEALEPRQEVKTMRIFSYNEIDLLCRLTGFEILKLYGATDVRREITDPNQAVKAVSVDPSYVFILKKV